MFIVIIMTYYDRNWQAEQAGLGTRGQHAGTESKATTRPGSEVSEMRGEVSIQNQTGNMLN